MDNQKDIVSKYRWAMTGKRFSQRKIYDPRVEANTVEGWISGRDPTGMYTPVESWKSGMDLGRRSHS